ncbi:MAG: hypothetical protein AAFX06_16070 [Planctomycetota bacterium]
MSIRCVLVLVLITVTCSMSVVAIALFGLCDFCCVVAGSTLVWSLSLQRVSRSLATSIEQYD